MERCLLSRVTSAIEPLDIAQGGFRKHRGTQESIACLNESIIQFEKEHHGASPVIAFMDIKAAYDSVDHTILFNRLAQTSLDPNICNTVRSLFTGIRSRVAVNGVESEEFEHTAGVLQGAILSPVLYSLYINSLAEELRKVRPDCRTVFMYADDLAFIADSEQQMEDLLKVAEQHSERNNYRFNARKCELMNATEGRLKIYNTPMPICQTFKYLGCIFDIHGIRWDLHIERIEAKTVKILNFFRSIGFNAMGFRERTRLTIMKAFIRSTFEFCLALMPRVQMWLKRLDSLQHKCLCTMLSVNFRTSQAAIQVLTGVVDIGRRHAELSARFCDSTSKRPCTFMSTAVRDLSKAFMKRRSCFSLIDNHPILDEHETLVQVHEEYRADLVNGAGNVEIGRSTWTLEKTIKFTRAMYLEELREKCTHLKWLPIDFDCKPRMWYALGRLHKKDARLCTLWTIGKIPGKPKRCKSCRTKTAVTYKHFLSCSGRPKLDEMIRDGTWDSLVLALREIVPKIEGLEYLVGESTYVQWRQPLRLDNNAVVQPPRSRNQGRYHNP